MQDLALTQQKLRVCIIGLPNTGKTALFNRLTGALQTEANYAGVTVASAEAPLIDIPHVSIEDTPGFFGLNAHSEDEKITVEALKHAGERTLLLLVFDAGSLERSISLLLELDAEAAAKGWSLWVVLNRMDAVQSKKRAAARDAARRLACYIDRPVYTVSSATGEGLDVLGQALGHLSRQGSLALRKGASVLDRAACERLLHGVESKRQTEKWDAWLLHPVKGPLLLGGLLLTFFQLIFWGSILPMELIQMGLDTTRDLLLQGLPIGIFQDMLVEGMLPAWGAVCLFLPQITLLFVGLFLFEETGLLPRASFLSESVLRAFGLPGRALIPLLTSFGCTIPGVMATRGIHHYRERLATLAVVPLIPCSARFPVYVLLVGTFIPTKSSWGGLISLQGLVLFVLYLSGFIAAVFTAKGLQWLGFFSKQHSGDVLYHLELPELKVPRWSRLSAYLWDRLKGFIVRLSGVLILGGMVLWYLSHFPKDLTEDPLASSYAGRVGHWLEPLFQACGFDWKIIVSLIPSFAARELVIGALATLYGSEPGQLSEVLAAAWSLPTALALLTWFIFAAQCFSTLAVLGSEAKSWWFPLGVFVYLNTLAYVGAVSVYQVSVRLL